MHQTKNLRVVDTTVLQSPDEITQELPLSERGAEVVVKARSEIEAILRQIAAIAPELDNSVELLEKALGTTTLTLEKVRAFQPASPTLQRAKMVYEQLVSNGITQQEIKEAKESLEPQLKQAAAALLERVPAGGSFHVRLERRGLAGRVATQEIERAVAEHLFELAAARGIALRTDFQDPDFVVAAETVGEECGVALVTRELRARYPFVRVH